MALGGVDGGNAFHSVAAKPAAAAAQLISSRWPLNKNFDII